MKYFLRELKKIGGCLQNCLKNSGIFSRNFCQKNIKMVLLAVCFLCQNCVNSEFDESLQDNNQASPYLNQPRGYRPEYVAPNPPIYPNPGQYSGQYPSQMPPSRYYSNPYAIPNQQNPYGRYDYDQYYVAPKYYYNTEPEQRFDNMRRY